MKHKINDNKTVREASIKQLINSLMLVDLESFTQLQKTILIEVLNNGKSFSELSNIVNLTSTRQKAILTNTVNILDDYLKTLNDRQKQYEETQKEITELRNWKHLLEASVEKEKVIDPKLKQLLLLPIEMTGLTTRVQQICYKYGICNVSDLIKYSRLDFLKLRNCGKHSISEIEDFFEKNRLSWNMKV